MHSAESRAHSVKERVGWGSECGRRNVEVKENSHSAECEAHGVVAGSWNAGKLEGLRAKS